MAVFEIGAGAPKAPESAGAPKRAAAADGAVRAKVAAAAGDVVETSAAPDLVGRLLGKLAKLPEVREDVVSSYRELLSRGLVDTKQAAQKAAQAILQYGA